MSLFAAASNGDIKGVQRILQGGGAGINDRNAGEQEPAGVGFLFFFFRTLAVGRASLLAA